MLFPTTIILALLATVTPVLSLPVAKGPNALVARSDEASLEARDLGLELPMEVEKRDAELYEELFARDADMYEDLVARDGDLYEELIARSPEPAPEMEEMERRGKLGFLVKIGKGIAKLFHHSHNNNNNNNNGQKHRKRSKVGNFFKKVWGGIKKVAKTAIKLVTRTDEAAKPVLARRGGVQIDNLEARNFEMDKRSKIGNFFKKVWGGIKKVAKTAIKLVTRSEESSPLEARSFDDAELETRSFDEPEELNARSFDDFEELEARSFEDEEY